MHPNYGSSRPALDVRSLTVAAVVGGLAGVLTAVLFGVFTRGEPSAVEEARHLVAITAPSAETTLERERQARLQLAGEVEMLRAELDLLAELLAELSPELEEVGGASREAGDGLAGFDSQEAQAAAASNAEGSELQEGNREAQSQGRPWFDAAALAAAGLPPSEIQRLRDRWEEYEMDRLYLQDRALRDGEQRTRVTREQRAELENEIREELGEEDYDMLLYASGQPNRVTVQEVLGTSPGLRAGLTPGDTIISYNGTRVYRPRDLRTAITATRAGSLVWVEVRSEGGEERNLRIPGGPIGIQMGVNRETPSLR